MADDYTRRNAAWKEQLRHTKNKIASNQAARAAAPVPGNKPTISKIKPIPKEPGEVKEASRRARANQELLSDSARGGLRSKLAPGPTNQGGAPKAGQATKSAAAQAAATTLTAKPKKAASRSTRQSVSKGKSVSTRATKTAATKTPRKPRAPKAK